jgi:Spy/CpxP family protein refolding chaperone
MKKLVGIVVVLVAVGLIVSGAYAHCGKCAKGKKAASTCGVAKSTCGTEKQAGCPMAAAFGKLNLTKEQEAKIAAIRKECATTLASKKTCAKTAAATRKASMAKMKAVLTPEQTAQLDKLMAAAKKTK